jgi:4-carboxymuconolactone decarboxylase
VTTTAPTGYRQVMTVEAAPASTPAEQVQRDFVFGRVWPRPGLGRRERRLVTLVCVGAADAQQPIDDHVYAALNSGDLTLDEVLEFVLHFAVYCGWPKASRVERVVRVQWARIQQERGEEPAPWPELDDAALGDRDRRIDAGVREFAEVNLIDAPAPTTPYIHAGILDFVFGHVWLRPGLNRRDRRFITVACVAVSDAPTPLISHTGAALESGDITPAEMDELILHFSVYSGFAKGEALSAAADRTRARLDR